MQSICLWLFAASGFAGLIYESLWTQYLKLFLGHAAYAQMIVLIVFMGGMTLGAMLTARNSQRLKNLLLIYAILEVLIGVIGITFHGTFTTFSQWMYQTILPSSIHPLLTTLLQWGGTALFILIPSMMLGATFPLMTGALIRYLPKQEPTLIPRLYFVNSFGAAMGILCAGFAMIPFFGLPGTLQITGIINIAIGIAVFMLLKKHSLPKIPKIPKPNENTHVFYSLMIIGAMLTGCASFMYEISWIRMLSLVLGASTHAFELMVSAFVLGLALGSLWIARRIKRIKAPLEYLGIVQIAMAILAVSTLLLYNQLFEVMSYLLQALGKSTQAYGLFHLVSHLICLALMLPATFCAGMTLPLMTHVLFKNGVGEASIGKVYAANTLGAIVGTLLAVLLVMPNLGLKAVISMGAMIDLSLGAVLLLMAYRKTHRQTFYYMSGTATVFVLAIITFVELDTVKMSSGVFRYRSLPQERTMIFHQDGKTASVDVYQNPHTLRLTLATNGKPDASINRTGKASLDESTQILMGIIPWAIHPQTKTAAVIGMGSSMTSQMLLESPKLERLDTIEIEPAMISGAKIMAEYFGNKTFKDPRSQIHIDDAKSFFAKQKQGYDLIISEPSNPWVSGIANLFSEEFYRTITRHLNENGIFTQWFQLYEINPKILSSVAQALGNVFPYYDVYFTYRGDILLIASQKPIPPVSDAPFQNEAMQQSLSQIDVQSVTDLQFRKLGSKNFLHPYFQSLGGPVNSDYYPYVDNQAPKARFLGENFYDLIHIKSDGLPLARYLDGSQRELSLQNITETDYFPASSQAKGAMAIYFYAMNGEKLAMLTAEDQLILDRLLVDSKIFCRHDQNYWIDHMKKMMHITLPYLNQGEMKTLWQKLEPGVCRTTNEDIYSWLSLYEAFIEDDQHTVLAHGQKLLKQKGLTKQDRHRVVGLMMLNQIRVKPSNVLKLQEWLPKDEPQPMQIQALISLAEHAIK